MISGYLAEFVIGLTVFFDGARMKLYINGILNNDAEVIVRWAGFGLRNMGIFLRRT